VAAHQHGVAIRRGFCHQLRADNGAATGSVVDDDLLAKALGQFIGVGARDDVVAAAWWIGHDDAHGARGVRLCLCQRGSHTEHTQKTL
jgi:hypothetical protein